MAVTIHASDTVPDRGPNGRVAADQEGLRAGSSLPVETVFLTAMGRVATYAVTGDLLELKTAEGKVGLKFTATQAPLA